MKFKIKNLKLKISAGISLLEILVAVAIFAVLGVMVTRSIALTLRGSKKSELTLKVRENIGYSLSVIERQLRNADSITSCSSDTEIGYIDSFGNPSTFSCEGMDGGDPYIASGSARLTSNEVKITKCTFSCTSTEPPAVNVSITAIDSQAEGVEGASVTASTKVYLRTY